jgi:hypothetical protein
LAGDCAKGNRQRELADEQHLALDLLDGAIHLVLLVREDAQPSELARHPIGLPLTVALLDTEQHTQPAPDPGVVVVGGHVHGCLLDALNDGDHGEGLRLEV